MKPTRFIWLSLTSQTGSWRSESLKEAGAFLNDPFELNSSPAIGTRIKKVGWTNAASLTRVILRVEFYGKTATGTCTARVIEIARENWQKYTTRKDLELFDNPGAQVTTLKSRTPVALFTM